MWRHSWPNDRSLVSIQAHPIFDPAGEPASPERGAFRRAAGGSTEGLISTVEPVLHHTVTYECLAGPFVLLWVRGDDKAWAIKRLEAIAENPAATRYERTTTVPLIDDLVSKLIPGGSRFQSTSILFSSISLPVDAINLGSVYSTYGRQAHGALGLPLRSPATADFPRAKIPIR